MEGQDQRGTDRRGFLRTTGLAGAAAAVLTTVGAAGASADHVYGGLPDRGQPVPDHLARHHPAGPALGGYEYGGSANQVFYGYVGDVRIVNRPLKVSEFIIAK